MDLLGIISKAWGWMGIVPKEVLEMSAFGNVILKDDAGRYWRICPEELSCTMIAETAERYRQLLDTSEFRLDWEMGDLVGLAKRLLGPISADRCYCLKMPSVLGGKYDEENLGMITRSEILAFSGHM